MVILREGKRTPRTMSRGELTFAVQRALVANTLGSIVAFVNSLINKQINNYKFS